ncbi:MAG: tRNA (adenosine(37)-N6)-threonylcarbamoyltransferase complex dimerization subunit type 1 TsaB [Tissierellia bacterium]|nr:tRNA (adenosine(37)-N6)-threonylcarbamoyltransferase complex dimerization subunit type 1 TsaB [Tissierellia bacterium]
MRILAIDTSTMISTITICEDGEIIGDFNVNQQKTHSESLVPMIESLLKLLGIKIDDIDLYVIAKGPGSFTGLRIGMTVIKTLAQVHNKPVVSVSTLKALALNVFSEKYTISLIDARGKRVYAAMYEGNDKKVVIKEDLYNIEDFSKLVNEYQGEKILVGLVANKYKDLFNNSTVSGFNYDNCIGRSLIRLSENEKKHDNLFDIVPEYMRKSQAERDLKK